jgi:L-glyceraldehyde 3-phosphate reductase
MTYKASENRYENKLKYTYCGKSGLQLPQISLGLWHNFGISTILKMPQK